MPSGQRGVVKVEGEPLPSVNIFIQVPLLSKMVVEVRKGSQWTNKSRLVAMEDLPLVIYDNKVIVKLKSKLQYSSHNCDGVWA